MDVESQSTNTSADDKTEDFCENPTRDALAEGLMCLLKPTIDTLDERVAACSSIPVKIQAQKKHASGVLP
nr:PREDICTED: SNAPIN protein homolog [Bemisia tabaci]